MVAPKPTLVAQVDANGCTQAHSGGTSRLLWSQSQVDFNCRNPKPASAEKLLVFSIFSFDFSFQKSFLFFAS
jgi:hypothetical protein